MKLIDLIIENFQAASFIKGIKKGGEGWCEHEISNNYKDYNDICEKLSYLKFFKGDLQSIFRFESLIEKQVFKFFKEKKEINKKNIEKFFFKKGIYSFPAVDKIDNYGETVDFPFIELLKTYTYQGILFQKIKEFSLIYKGFISFKSSKDLVENDQYSIICFYSKTDKKYHLLVLFLESDGNDSYQYLKSFKKKPSINEVKTFINKSSIPSFFDFWKKNSSIDLHESFKNIDLDKYWSKALKGALNLEYKEQTIHKDEKSFYEIFKSDVEIDYNYVINNPKEYLNGRNPAPYLNTYLKRNPKKKIKSSKFCNYIMGEDLNYKNDINFLKSIEFTYFEDLNGLLNKIPKKLLENKSLSDEINKVKMFRTNNRGLLIKIFNANSDQLYSVVQKYLPKKWFNDRNLVIKMVNLDSDIISLIGDKLKYNKKFMDKIYKS